jgi:hypothetical protein
MMLRSLVDEVVRRRLWPIPLVALLVVIAAPLLFMKSTPAGAPAATEVPPAAAPGQLPNAAEKVMSTSDRTVVSHKRSTLKREDPFAPPQSAVVKKTTATSSTSSSSSTAKTSTPAAVPVVIKNADGSTTKATIGPATSTSKSPAKTTATKKKSTTPKTTTPAKIVTYVDIRFGKKMGTMLRYRVPRLQTFQAGRKVAAMFVGYSAKRNAAVFAVAPSTKVSGVTCRKVDKVCRYVDLAEGRHARLTLRAADGTITSRRLDVVGIRHLPQTPASTASARTTSLPAAKCLLKGLLTLTAIAPSLPVDACE